jgi:hypothetical protein
MEVHRRQSEKSCKSIKKDRIFFSEDEWMAEMGGWRPTGDNLRKDEAKLINGWYRPYRYDTMV